MIIWLGTLLKCEILTVLHGDEFYPITKEDEYTFGDVDYLKVMEYDGTNAKVYFVANEKNIAFLINFRKNDGQWTYSLGHTIWSTKGSASEVIFPYWWHFIYGGL